MQRRDRKNEYQVEIECVEKARESVESKAWETAGIAYEVDFSFQEKKIWTTHMNKFQVCLGQYILRH